MRIKKLVVKKTKPVEEVIRDIDFNLEGLNLIIDSTENMSKKSGNSVGKTTVVRIIDICLGAKHVTALYTDKDTKSVNVEIRDLLKDSKVEAELTITDGEKEYVIVQPLYPRGKRRIDGKVYKYDDFRCELKEILFDLKETNPTLRQLIPRFVRLEDTQLDNIVNYLTMTSKETYEDINLFLFKIQEDELVSKKNVLEEKLRNLNNKLNYFKKDKNILSLEFLYQRRLIIEKDLEEANDKRKNIDYVKLVKMDDIEAVEIQKEIDKVNSDIEILEFEKSMIEKSIEELKTDKVNIDVNVIKQIYEDAKAFNDRIHKEFNEVLEFHNKMIDNRIKFIQPKLEIKNKIINEKRTYRETLIIDRNKMNNRLIDEELLKDIEGINLDIDKLNVEKGEVSKAITILEDLVKEIKSTNDDLSSVNNKMIENNEDDNDKMKKFNEYFSEYSNELYGEKYIYVYNPDWKSDKEGHPFTVGNVMGGMGAGKKRGLIVAFDLAYLKFINEYQLCSPQFIIHDKMENTHINQLRTIFNLCSQIKGQYIIPILRERISQLDSDIIEKSKIIELSEDNKFFRI